MSPIHPSLALLAGAAKRKNWAGLQKQLEAALRKPAWLRPEHRVGDPTGYMRHLIYVDPHGDFVMTAITWLPGQVSALHGHRVWCAFGVAEGELTEEQFDAQAAAAEDHRVQGRRAGRPRPRTAASSIASPTAAAQPLVSLHLYGVSADKLTTGINRYFK